MFYDYVMLIFIGDLEVVNLKIEELFIQNKIVYQNLFFKGK